MRTCKYILADILDAKKLCEFGQYTNFLHVVIIQQNATYCYV